MKKAVKSMVNAFKKLYFDKTAEYSDIDTMISESYELFHAQSFDKLQQIYILKSLDIHCKKLYNQVNWRKFYENCRYT